MKKQAIEAYQLGSKDIGSRRKYSGTVVTVEDLKPLLVSQQWECPSCGKVTHILQLNMKSKNPGPCGCGRKGRMRCFKEEYIDTRMIYLKKNQKQTDAVPVLLKGKSARKKIKIGNKLTLRGYVKTRPRLYRRAPTRHLEFFIEVDESKI